MAQSRPRGHALDHSGGYASPREQSPARAANAVNELAQGPELDTEKAITTGISPSHTNSLNAAVSGGQDRSKYRKVGLRDRICYYQWTYFTMTMATGGVANAICAIPFNLQWIKDIGLIFCFLNLILFVVNCVCITLRFHLRPGSFMASLRDQTEALFVPSFFVSIAVIIVTITEYGVPRCGPWLVVTIEMLFWVYIGASTFISATMYLMLWSTTVFPIHTMTPVWVFPAYPLLITAPMASALLGSAALTDQLHLVNSTPVALGSLAVQGTGWLISFTISAAFIYRLMTQKLPRDSQRPGIFISVGPSGFTVAGIVGLANISPELIPSGFMGVENAAGILKVLAVMVGLWLWGLSVWFFIVSLGSLFKYLIHRDHKIPYNMTWFSFVFPNTALVTATIQLGNALGSVALQLCGCVVTACLVVVWLLVLVCMIRAHWKRQLLWPKDED